MVFRHGKDRRSEAGNVFFTLFGAVALVGVIGAATTSLIRGPVGTVITLNQKAKVDSQLQLAIRLAAMESVDCDGDGVPEPPAPVACSGGVSGPAGGGCIPSIGAIQTDPWGSTLGLCAWDPEGPETPSSACGGTLLQGTDDPKSLFIAVISAGPDRQFQTSCSDGPPAVSIAGDDIVEQWIFETAAAGVGEGLWQLKSGDEDVITTDKALEISRDTTFSSGATATFQGSAQFGSGSRLRLDDLGGGLGGLFSLPSEVNLPSGQCNATNSGVLRRNTDGGTKEVLEICAQESGIWGFRPVADDAKAAGNPGDIQFHGPDAMMAATGDLNWSGSLLNVSGALDLSGLADVGSLAVAGTSQFSGGLSNPGAALTVDDDFAVTGGAQVTGILAVTGTSEFTGSLSNPGLELVVDDSFRVTGATELADTLTVTGQSFLKGSISNPDGNITVDDFLTVTGQLDVMQATILQGTLDARGNIFNSTGDLTLDDTVTIKGPLTVEGVARFNEKVTLDRTLSLQDMGQQAGGSCASFDAGSITFDGTNDQILICSIDAGYNWVSVGTSGGGGGGSGGKWDWAASSPDIRYTAGDVGIGVNDPQDPLHVSGNVRFDGSVTSKGLFFDATENSLAAGIASSATGQGSIALGQYALASGQGSVSLAYGSEATGAWSTAMGHKSRASGANSTSMGWENTASGDNATAGGQFSIASGNTAVAFGNSATASSYVAVALGEHTAARAMASTAMGQRTVASGTGSIAMGSYVLAGNGSENGALNGGFGNHAMAVGLLSGNYATPATRPRVTGDRSYGIFMGAGDDAQANVNLTANDVMALIGGRLAIDPRTGEGVNAKVTPDATLALDVEGDIGAIQFCNEEGQYCFSAEDIAGGNTGVFEEHLGVIRSASGIVDYTTTHFLFGSPAMESDGNAAHANRLFFDKAKGAFRAGSAAAAQWNAANVGSYSVALGQDTIASGGASTALGYQTTASAAASTALGGYNIAAGDFSTVMGGYSAALGSYSTASGVWLTASGENSMAAGRWAVAGSGTVDPALGAGFGNFSVALGLLSGTHVTAATRPRVTGDRSYGIFMGAGTDAQASVNITASDVMALVGGKLVIDPRTGQGAGAAVTPSTGVGPKGQPLVIDVEGAIGGTHFCDENGESCFAATDVSNNSSVFELASGVIRPTSGVTNYQTDHFVVGSPSMNNDGVVNHRNRMFFHKAKAAFRVGTAQGTQWDDASLGSNSFAAGLNSTASGARSISIGHGSSATGVSAVSLGYVNDAAADYSLSAGQHATASGVRSISLGYYTIASGENAVSIGMRGRAEGEFSTAMGRWGRVTGSHAMAVSLVDGSYGGAAWMPTVSGARSLGLFMGTSADLQNTNITAADVMALVGGKLVIDPRKGLGAGAAVTPSVGVGPNGQPLVIDVQGAIGGTHFCDQDGENCFTAGDVAGGSSGVFELAGGVIRPSSGVADYANNNFLFGAPTMSGDGNADHYNRMFFNKSKGAFRAGRATSHWDDANVGDYSIVLGNAGVASGENSVAIGLQATASNNNTLALGSSAVASGNAAVAIGLAPNSSGNGSTAIGPYAASSGLYSFSIGFGTNSTSGQSMAFGSYTQATGWASTAMGNYVESYGPSSMALGLIDSHAAETRPRVSGARSYGVFMGNGSDAQASVDITATDVMALVGGKFVIDPRTGQGAGAAVTPSTGVGPNGQPLVIDVQGAIGGTHFCDQDGENCFTAGDVTGASGSGIFELASGVVRPTSGVADYVTNNFLFGSPTLNSDGNNDHSARMFFNKTKGAFRAGNRFIDGIMTPTQWDDANVGENSVAMGHGTTASAKWSTAFGLLSSATGPGSFAAGMQTLASGEASVALGSAAIASGPRSTSFGNYATAGGSRSVAYGLLTGVYANPAIRPRVTGDRSYAIFMGSTDEAQSNVNVTATDVMALVGGKLVIDPRTGQGAGAAVTPSTGVGPNGQPLVIDVQGAIGGTHFCDQDGENCFTAANVSGGPRGYDYKDHYRITIGEMTIPSGDFELTLGADADYSNVIGAASEVRGMYGKAIGTGVIASGYSSMAFGHGAMAGSGTAQGKTLSDTGWSPVFDNGYGHLSVAFGLTNTRNAGKVLPRVTGDRSFAVFMGHGSGTYENQESVNVTASDVMALVGGKLVIDPRVGMGPAAAVTPSTGVGANGQPLVIDVEGAIGGSYFCDQDGENCVAGSDLGSPFVLDGSIVRSRGDYATENFVFGSPTLHTTKADHRARFFFDKAKAAFRAGTTTSTQWQDANVGSNSVGFGNNVIASGLGAFSVGTVSTASGNYSTSIGGNATAAGTFSVAIGGGNNALLGVAANGSNSIVIGRATQAGSDTVNGAANAGHGVSSLAVGLLSGPHAAATRPRVTGDRSFGVFMGSGNNVQANVNVTASDVMALVGGKLVIDPRISQGAAAAVTPSTGVGPNGQPLVIDVEGAIGGTHFCDQDGENCFSAADVSGGGDGVFEVASGVVRPTSAAVNYASDHFLFGAPSMDWDGSSADYESRMFFNKAKSAFRAGRSYNDSFYVDGTEWNDANVGTNSAAFGSATRASGDASTAMGSRSAAFGATSFAAGYMAHATGTSSLAFGYHTSATSDYSIAMGENAYASGESAVAIGSSTQATAQGSVAIGLGSTASEFASTALGYGTTASGGTSVAAGFETTASGDYGVSFGEFSQAEGRASFAMGSASVASGDGSVAMGDATTAAGNFSFAMGSDVQAQGQNSVVFGVSSSTPGVLSTAIGFGNSANSARSIALGSNVTTTGYNSIAMGHYAIAGSGVVNDALGGGFGNHSMAVGLLSGTHSSSPRISGDRSYGVFMGGGADAQANVNITASDVMALVGGKLVIDPRTGQGAGAAVTPSTGVGPNGQPLVIDVEGAIGGTYFCDQNGENCFTAADVGGGGSGGGVFELASGVVRPASGSSDYTSDSFLFGAPTMNYSGVAAHSSRMFYNKAEAAFRAGWMEDTKWDSANLGQFSVAMGYDTSASAGSSVAMGDRTSASGHGSVAMGMATSATEEAAVAFGSGSVATAKYAATTGYSNTASGVGSFAWGGTDADSPIYFNSGNIASGLASMAGGVGTSAVGQTSVALGTAVHAIGNQSMALGLISGDNYNVGVKGHNSFGIFMSSPYSTDSITNRNILGNNIMAVVGGRMVITPNVGAGGGGDIDVAPNTGVGPSGQALMLDVDGPIGGTHFCDEAGENCFTAADVADSASVGGTEGNIQFNSGGALGAVANLNWDNANTHLQVTGIISATDRIAVGATAGAAEPIGIALHNLSDVSVASPTTGQVLQFNGTNWTATDASSGAAGNDGDIQFNNDGDMDATSNLNWNNSESLLQITGDIEYTGTLTDISDRRLKTDITPLDAQDVLNRLAQVQTYTFRMKADERGRLEYGVMAQELETVFPELVHTANDNMQTKSVNYVGLISPLIEATKNLKAENDNLRTEIESMQAERAAWQEAMVDMQKDIRGLKAHTGYTIGKAGFGGWALVLVAGAVGASSAMVFTSGILRRRRKEEA